MTSSRLAGLAATTAILAMTVAGANAQDIDGALERLQALSSDQGMELEWSNVEISGNDAELIDVRAGDGDTMVPIGNVALTGISEDDEAYRIETMMLPRFEAGDEEGAVSVNDVIMNGLVLPRQGEDGPMAGYMYYENVSIADASVSVGGAELFSMTNLQFDLTAPANGEPMRFSGGAETLDIDVTAMEGADGYPVFEALGYQQISGYFQVAGSWDLEDGRLEISQHDLSMTDAGTLGLTFAIDGYTPELIEAMREVEEQMADDPESSAHGMAMLGLAQQLSLESTEVVFSDDGLTQNIIGYVANEQGVSSGDVVNQLKAMLPFMLAQLNSQELTTMITNAASTFLDDPQTLRISAYPEENVPFALLMAGAMAAPEGLIETLGLTITANE